MTRVRLESILSLVCAAMGVLTAITPEWIEVLTGHDPDHGSGALEWLIVVGFGVFALASATMARRHYRRLLTD